MRFHRIGLALLGTMVLGFASLTYAAPFMVTETFDSAASTAADGWVGSNNVGAGNDFGFSNTGTVSGIAGEVGGVFARSSVFRYFADTTLAGSLSRTETLVVGGSLQLNDDDFDGTIFVGYFNTGDLVTFPGSEFVPSGPFIGIGINEPVGDGAAFRASARIYDNTGARIWSPEIALTQGTTYTFNLIWAGNPDGSGTLSGTIGGTPVSITREPSVDVVNAFGIGSAFVRIGSEDSTLQTAPSFFDNLSYSTYSPILPVPEPSTMLLLCTGLVGLAGLRRRFKT